jgi:hypothetical protein
LLQCTKICCVATKVVGSVQIGLRVAWCLSTTWTSRLPSLIPRRLALCVAPVSSQRYPLRTVWVPRLVIFSPGAGCCSLLSSATRPRCKLLVAVSRVLDHLITTDSREAVEGLSSLWRRSIETHWPPSNKLLMPRRDLLFPSTRLLGALWLTVLCWSLRSPELLCVSELLCIYVIHGFQMFHSNYSALGFSTSGSISINARSCIRAALRSANLGQVLARSVVSLASQEQQLLLDLLLLHRASQRLLLRQLVLQVRIRPPLCMLSRVHRCLRELVIMLGIKLTLMKPT